MDLKKLYEILSDTTIQLRKGEVLHGTPELVGAIERREKELPGGVRFPLPLKAQKNG